MDKEAEASKPHRPRKAGRKAEKRKNAGVEPGGEEPKRKNPKAFSIQNANKLNRTFRRAQDMKTKKHHIPVVDRTPVIPAPTVVAIVGPPKVGKTTLMKGIIQNYTRQKVTNIKGPVTLVSGKHKRLTLIECKNDLCSMIDVAKVADIILLLIDANFGFEMETFEFLNMCQVTGFPKVMGVLTHLDTITEAKTAKKKKKALKQRLWTEVYQGAKLFFLSKVVYGEYQRMEVKNLCRFIGTMKMRPLVWKSSHPYVLADRMEDITDAEQVRTDPKSDRTVAVFGYVRGTNLKPDSKVHVPGVGDFRMEDVSFLHDPCPLTQSEKKRRMLDCRDRIVFAPMSGVGGIIYDKDATYIEVNEGGKGAEGQRKRETEELDEEEEAIMADMLTTDRRLADKLATQNPIRITNESAPLISMPEEERVFDEETGRSRRRAVFDDDDDDAESDDEEEEEGDEEVESEDDEDDGEADSDGEDEEENDENSVSEALVKVDSDDEAGTDSDDDDDDDDIMAMKWKVNLAQKAKQSFIDRQTSTTNLMKLVYGEQQQQKQKEENEEQEEEEDDGELFKVHEIEFSGVKNRRNHLDDCSISPHQAYVPLHDWSSVEGRDYIADCFVTGEWKEGEDAKTLLEQDEAR